MSWMNQIGGILQQYAGAGRESATADRDFDEVSRSAPGDALGDAIAAAFRSERTPPFGQMVEQLFRRANGEQRAGLLNTLLGAVGPMIVSEVLSRFGLSQLAGTLQGGRREVTPEEAEQVPPEAAQQIAERAEAQDGSIMDRLGSFLAAHPELVKTLGTSALSLAMSRLASRQT